MPPIIEAALGTLLLVLLILVLLNAPYLIEYLDPTARPVPMCQQVGFVTI